MRRASQGDRGRAARYHFALPPPGFVTRVEKPIHFRSAARGVCQCKRLKNMRVLSPLWERAARNVSNECWVRWPPRKKSTSDEEAPHPSSLAEPHSCPLQQGE